MAIFSTTKFEPNFGFS